MSKIDKLAVRICPDTLPDDSKLEPGYLYVSDKYRTAVHLCACGCGNKVVTPIKSWGWSLDLSVTRTGEIEATLRPSIGSFNLGCKSHYFITSNKVIWV